MEILGQAWLSKLREEFLKLEPLFPTENFLPDEGLPKWVENVECEIGATMYPVAKLKRDLKLTPKRMGAMLGHSCAYAVWMIEALEVALSKANSGIELRAFTSVQIENDGKFVLGIVGAWYPALRRLAKRALCSAVDQTYEDMTAFLLAYSGAFSQKPKSLGYADVGNSVFEIYIFLLTNWRLVNALHSVRELHELLVKHMGSHRVGELKRVEKICQRIGLHYRKPGRPKRVR